MKKFFLKTISLFIVFVFVFCGCTEKKENNSSVVDASYINDSSANNGRTDTSFVSNEQETISTIVSTNSSGIVSQSKPRPVIYEYYGDDYDIEFIEWCKECKVNDDFYKKYPDSKGFIDFIKTQNTIFMPKIKNDDYEIYCVSASSVSNVTYYRFIYKTKESINAEFNVETASQVAITFAPIPKELEGKSDKDILKSRLEDWEIKEDTSLYGTYAIKKSNHTVAVQVIRNDFIVNLRLYDGRKPISEWGNKYWDLFELETVSLK